MPLARAKREIDSTVRGREKEDSGNHGGDVGGNHVSSGWTHMCCAVLS